MKVRYQIIIEEENGKDTVRVRSSVFGFFWEYEVVNYDGGLNEYKYFKDVGHAKMFIRNQLNKY